MFSYYTYVLGKIIRRYNLQYHRYADDIQIYIQFDPKIPGDAVCALHKLQLCAKDIKLWMNPNKLKLNEDKTEFFIAASQHNIKFLKNVTLDVCGTTIYPSSSIRNLGVHFDSKMTMSHHVSSLTRSLNFHIRNIGRIRRYLDEDTCNHVTRSLVLSRLDYSNSLLYGITTKDTQRLQTIQNRAAKLIFKANRRDHATPFLKKLHWLPVKERIRFKVLALAFKGRMDETPRYLSSLVKKKKPSKYNLRSNTDNTLFESKRTNSKTYGDKAYENTVPALWNKLPKTLRSSASTTIFKSRLKTHLFPK